MRIGDSCSWHGVSRQMGAVLTGLAAATTVRTFQENNLHRKQHSLGLCSPGALALLHWVTHSSIHRNLDQAFLSERAYPPLRMVWGLSDNFAAASWAAGGECLVICLTQNLLNLVLPSKQGIRSHPLGNCQKCLYQEWFPQGFTFSIRQRGLWWLISWWWH